MRRKTSDKEIKRIEKKEYGSKIKKKVYNS